MFFLVFPRCHDPARALHPWASRTFRSRAQCRPRHQEAQRSDGEGDDVPHQHAARRRRAGHPPDGEEPAASQVLGVHSHERPECDSRQAR